jgi:hypothetical protein
MSPRAFEENSDAILEVGMCPIKVEKDETAKFLLRVCQVAKS